MNIEDLEITNFIFNNLPNDNFNCKYGAVLGNYELQKYRVMKAVQLYKYKNIQKIIFSGGNNGISNYENNKVPEAILMKELALKMGVKEEDIIVESNSKNTIENIKNVYNILKKVDVNKIIIITSQFHLKRSYLIARDIFPNQIKIKMVPSTDGFTDKDNWYKNDIGRTYVINEAKYIKEYLKMKG